MPVKVFITIDVECGEFSPDYEGCVWGRLGNMPAKEFGLPLILDLLKQENLKAVFFVEALSSFRHGFYSLKTIIQRILSEGHEIQLHIHPSLRHLTRKPDAEIHLGKYPLSKQIELIKSGLDVVEKCGGKKITAFRAGGFGINKDTFHALGKCGFLYDSSYNLNYLNSSCLIKLAGPPHNDVFQYENILEFPVTCFRNPFSSKVPFRHLQITASSYQEIKKALLIAHEKKMKSVTILLHSFEFIKFFDKERTLGKPNNINIKRFGRLLKFLAVNRNLFEVSGFNDLSITYLNNVKRLQQKVDYIPKIPVFMKMHRQLEQLITRF